VLQGEEEGTGTADGRREEDGEKEEEEKEEEEKEEEDEEDNPVAEEDNNAIDLILRVADRNRVELDMMDAQISIPMLRAPRISEKHSTGELGNACFH